LHFANKVSGSRSRDWFEIKNATVAEDDNSDTATVYIFDEIGFWGTDAQSFVRQLLAIDKPKIELHLNSPGGEVFDGVAIYNALKSHSAHVDVIVDSLAASAASFIAQAGDTVTMKRGSLMMIHDASAICLGNEQDMLDTANILSKVSNNIADIYAQRAGEDQAFWRDLMKEEVWYTADEAVDANLADKVSEEDASSSPSDEWDLSVFNYQGRTDAPSPKQVRQLVFNRAKEASVGRPKNVAPEGAPSTDPEAPAEEQTPDEQETPATPVEPEAPAEPEAPTAPEAPAAQPENKAGVSFVINGVRTSDPAAIQAYIAGLEGAANENKKANRKAFIKNLCDEKKILASQVASLESFVLGTDTEPGLTDKQYESWCASWSAAPSLGVLSNKVTDGVTNPAGDTENTKNAEILTAVEIVRQHKRSNMPKDQLEKTPSYQTLVAANALDQI
jgi:ATP-dependent protease ClpP protease subunit